MIDRFVASGLADPQRIYVMGGSNGAMMTLRLACELTNKIADDGTTISVEEGADCNAPTRLMIGKGGGHQMPGTPERARPAGLPKTGGAVSREVDAAAYIWEFLLPHQLKRCFFEELLMAPIVSSTSIDLSRPARLTPSLALAACAALSGCTSMTAAGTRTPPERTVSEITLPARDGRALKAVLSMPNGPGPFPVLVTVHGGLGDRSYAVLRNVADPASDSPTVRAFNDQNWIIIAPGYRNDWFGAEETDLVDAIRHAVKLPKADPARVGVFGGSNGGRLTLRAAVLDPMLMKCIGAGSPFLTHPPDFFGDKTQPPWSAISPGAAAWMGPTRERLQIVVNMAAKRASVPSAQLMLDHSSQAHAGKIRARVLLLTSKADEQVPPVMVQGVIDELERAGNPAKVVAVDQSLHGFYWQREGEFGAREGRGAKTDEQRLEEDRALAATLDFFNACFAPGRR